MESIAGRSAPLTWALNLSIIAIVILWVFPTAGLLISSFRDRDQIATSGWWSALFDSKQNIIVRSQPLKDAIKDGDYYVLTDNIFKENEGQVLAFGVSSIKPDAFKPNSSVDHRSMEVEVTNNGDYIIKSKTKMESKRGIRLFITTIEPPKFTVENYKKVLFSEGIGRSFLNTLTVTIPATIIPILVAAFAAYALAWMKFPGRALLITIIVGLLVVPLQMALIPLLKLHNTIGIGKAYLGIWLAHTGFGLPLAIFLLRNYMIGLPREIIESSKVDGATDFQIFIRIILPLSFPALASFAIFQFLWVWNDLLVATVFLGNSEDQLVMTGRLRELLGSKGGDWEILATSAFVSVAVPIVVFFMMQKYFVRGLLAGSVK